MARATMADHKARSEERKKDIARDMVRLKGSKREDLVEDHRRGAGSPIGGGTHSRPGRRK